MINKNQRSLKKRVNISQKKIGTNVSLILNFLKELKPPVIKEKSNNRTTIVLVKLVLPRKPLTLFFDVSEIPVTGGFCLPNSDFRALK